ncbi:sensor histidine kinase [Streptomyces stelliscabiei]|uniref:sensor histidine kinase n=1 Tax=Streptomyces stelliscabiei TaxID=146820 RepID=UPI00062C86B9|nr:histidine kinase [Streptomyces stelliscabiei]KND44280.1 histidine kinase [Streptomyces stelliscabiei]MDX2521415.1 histidine kinase [Streptomyces stelliscabiei]
MRGPGAWWRTKSTPAKVETYTRWSFQTFPLIEVGGFGIPLFGQLPLRYAGWFFALVTVHGALCSVAVSRALDWVRGRRAQPVHLFWTIGVVSALVGCAAMVLADSASLGDNARAALFATFGGVLIFGVGTIALGVRSRRRLAAVIVAFATGSGATALATGVGGTSALAALVVVLIGTTTFALTSVFSVWLLTAVYELADARETRARLAVAEERLRFGRDLHDVIGRNLAVIALKSELAVQLARRERPEAVEQMIEVQRIAQESQREVRDVVRGYREADLGVELSGARGVLAAAGITCSVDGADTAGLPGEVQSALAWVVREGTTNVLRHGNAVRCTVVLRVTEGQAVLTVENDGIRATGAEEDGGRSVGAGSGLAGLRERLAVVDGTLEAGPVGEEVFRVVARVPLPSAESASAENSGSASTAGAAASGTSAAVGQAVVRGAAS